MTRSGHRGGNHNPLTIKTARSVEAGQSCVALSLRLLAGRAALAKIAGSWPSSSSSYPAIEQTRPASAPLTPASLCPAPTKPVPI